MASSMFFPIIQAIALFLASCTHASRSLSNAALRFTQSRGGDGQLQEPSFGVPASSGCQTGSPYLQVGGGGRDSEPEPAPWPGPAEGPVSGCDLGLFGWYMPDYGRTHGTVGCTTLADPRAQDAQAAWMRHTIRLCERLISGRQPSNNRQQPNQLRYCFSHPYRPQNLDHAYKIAHSANRLPHTLARRPFYIVPACRSCSSSAAPMPISPSTESVCSPRRGAVAPGRSGVALMRIGVPTTRRASPSSPPASAK